MCVIFYFPYKLLASYTIKLLDSYTTQGAACTTFQNALTEIMHVLYPVYAWLQLATKELKIS